MLKRLGLKPMDLVLIIVLAGVCPAWWAYSLTGRGDSLQVMIYGSSGAVMAVPLDNDRDVAVSGPLGRSIVRIQSGKVSMLWSPCAEKTCIHMGRIGHPGEGIVCLPNRVSVSIGSGSGGTDSVTY